MSTGAASLLLVFLVQQPAYGPPIPQPRIVPERGCPATTPGENEIVVCGQSSEDSPYRVPRAFRNQRSDDDRDASWDAQIRDQEALERFSSQNVGPSGITQHSRQVDCQWRAARQEMRGERPDCGKGLPF